MRILNKDMLTRGGNINGRQHALQILGAGLDLVDPGIGVKQLITRNGNKLVFDGPEFELKDDPRGGRAEYDLCEYDRVIVIGAAKGVQLCASALEEVLGDYLTGGHVIGKHGDMMLCNKLGVTLAGHPVPDECCVIGCEKIYGWIKDITPRDLVITIVGSGVSSLLTWPIEGVSIQDMGDLTRMLQIEKGALTSDLNAVRNHLDRFKGGRISRYLNGATIINLATNDVGAGGPNTNGTRVNYAQAISSNLFLATLADKTTFGDAINTLHKYDAWSRTPANIKEHLTRADVGMETVKVDEYESFNARLYSLTPKMRTVYPAMFKMAEELGYAPYMLTENMTAEAKDAGNIFAAIATHIENCNQPLSAPCALISSGELVVTVGDKAGVGGRNQEFCMAAALKIAGSDKIVVGAVDSDGTDGPGGLAEQGAPDCLCGAVVDGYTQQEAKNAGLDLYNSLKSHDTSAALWKLGCGISATPSISVLDLRVILIT